MTREEAINTLNEMWERLFTEMRGWIFEDLKKEGKLDEFKTAFDMAIKALEQIEQVMQILYDCGVESEVQDAVERELNSHETNRGIER